MPSCSKGSRGLSVLSRVAGIFTHFSNSLSTRQRQQAGRYAIRAGRNLPDKEFRYLRTVIVTAAVYWGFSSELSHLPLTFQHRAGVIPYTSSYDFAEYYVFDKQSPASILCHSTPLQMYILHGTEPTFSRSYGSILQSSFAWNLSIASVYSTSPPVSVCSTVKRISTLSSFSREHGFTGLTYSALEST